MFPYALRSHPLLTVDIKNGLQNAVSEEHYVHYSGHMLAVDANLESCLQARFVVFHCEAKTMVIFGIPFPRNLL